MPFTNAMGVGCCGCGPGNLTCLPCALPKSDLKLTWYYERYDDACDRNGSRTAKVASGTMTWSATPRQFTPGLIQTPANSWSTPPGQGQWLSFDGDNAGCAFWQGNLTCASGTLYLLIYTSRSNHFVYSSGIGGDNCRCQTSDGTVSTRTYGHRGQAQLTTATAYPSDCSGPTIRFVIPGTSILAATITLPTAGGSGTPGDTTGGSDTGGSSGGGGSSNPGDSTGGGSTGDSGSGSGGGAGSDSGYGLMAEPSPALSTSSPIWLAETCRWADREGPCGCGGPALPGRRCSHPARPGEVWRPDCLRCVTLPDWGG